MALQLTSANIATKKIPVPQAISALTEQAKRFEAMSVLIARSADLATKQANEIAQWTSKLISSLTKIQQDTQRDAAACRERVQDEIRKLSVQANSSKRKILETAELESSRTIRANFRLIFGPPRETAHPSKSAKYAKVTNLDRITTIRGLSRSHPHSVIAFSLTYPTKVWTEASSDIFDGLVKLIKDETEQHWPDEIVDIIDELEKERPMRDEVKNIRMAIIQCNDRSRQRIDPVPQQSSNGTQLVILPQPSSLATGQTQIEISIASANNQDTVGDKARPSQASTKENTNTESIKYGDVFTLNIEDARYALSFDQDVGSIFVTNPKTEHKIGDRSSFLTAWISEDMGELLGKRGQLVTY